MAAVLTLDSRGRQGYNFLPAARSAECWEITSGKQNALFYMEPLVSMVRTCYGNILCNFLTYFARYRYKVCLQRNSAKFCILAQTLFKFLFKEECDSSVFLKYFLFRDATS